MKNEELTDMMMEVSRLTIENARLTDDANYITSVLTNLIQHVYDNDLMSMEEFLEFSQQLKVTTHEQ